MTRIVRLSQTEIEKEISIKDVLGYCCPSTDEFLLRDDLTRDAKKDSPLSQKERYMNIVRPLFPNVTDEEYEDHMMPPLIKTMGLLWAQVHKGDHENMCEISTSLMRYVWHSLDTLNTIRCSGHFDDNKLPRSVANAIDNLIADCAGAMGGENSLIDKYRTRSPTKRAKQLGKDTE